MKEISPKLKSKGTEALSVAEILLRPNRPRQGPPVPESWSISWPSFIMRGIKRLKEEPPWKTIPRRGLREELKREFEVVTGRKID